MSSLQNDRITARTWLALTSVAFGTFALVTTEFLPVGLLKDIASSLAVSEGTAGLMVTMPGVVAAIAGPILMLAAGKIDRRLGLWLMTALLAVSNAIAALAPTFEIMLFGRFLLGLAVGGFWALAVSAAARMVSAEKMGVAIALILAGISVGTVFGVPAGAMIGELAGWRSAFVVNGLLAVAILLAQVILLPALPATKGVRIGDMLGLFKRRDALVGLVATGLVVTGHFAAYTYVTPLLVDLSGFDMTDVTILLAAYGVAAFVGNFIAGKVVTQRTRATLIGVSLLAAATMAVLPNVAEVPALSILLLVLWGVAFGGLPVALQTWMYKASGTEKESGQVVFNSLFQWALALGAFVGGVVVDGVDIASAVMLGGGLALLAALVVWVAVTEPRDDGMTVPASAH